MSRQRRLQSDEPLTEQEIRDMLKRPKVAVNTFSWVPQTGYSPASWNWRSALSIDGSVPQGLMMTAQWQQARLDELPKLYLSIVWKGQRVHAVDMGTQRHQNPHVPGATFAGQLVTAPIHQHFWISGFGIEYVEPVDISTDESTVFNFFIRSANLQIEGDFYHPEIQKDLFF